MMYDPFLPGSRPEVRNGKFDRLFSKGKSPLTKDKIKGFCENWQQYLKLQTREDVYGMLLKGYDEKLDKSLKPDSSFGHFQSEAEDEERDRIALDSQRSITRAFFSDEEKVCKVVHAIPDGNCGFTATRHYLNLNGKEDLSVVFTREHFRKTVQNAYETADCPEILKSLVEEMIDKDRCADISTWSDCFKSSSVWMAEHHFRCASYLYEIAFVTFYQDEGVFKLEPTYERIFESKEAGKTPAAVVYLAHVSTRCINSDGSGANLNHFDALIISPTDTQLDRIKEINGSDLDISEKPDTSTPFADDALLDHRDVALELGEEFKSN